MTDTLPPVPVETPEPDAPESSRSRLWWTLGPAIAVVAIAAGSIALGHTTPVADTVTPGICGAWLQVRPTTFNGVALDVAIPGPDTITVDLWGSFDEHRRLTQQVTKNSPGANFMSWDFEYKIRAIEVSIKDGSHCAVDSDILDQLNTANGHSR